jgi:hypothetical protein
MNLFPAELIPLALAGFVVLVAVAGFIVVVWALIDAVRRPSWAWAEADQQLIVWIVAILLGGIVGGAIYLVVAKPKLDAAVAAGPSTLAPPRF